MFFYVLLQSEYNICHMRKGLIFLTLVFVTHILCAQDYNNYNVSIKQNQRTDDTISAVLEIRDADLYPSHLADSVSLLYQSLALSNLEVRRINDAIHTHAVVSLIGFTAEGIGAALLISGETRRTSEVIDSHGNKTIEDTGSAMRAAGIGFCIAGGVAIIASYFPLFRDKIKTDERGLVVGIPIGRNYLKK